MQELEVGQKFERYRVLRFLGNGVSGESYEAEDMSLQRTVLLKLIHPWLMLSDSIRRQFFREMQHISSITHPYLTEILDYGEADSQLYLVRRYVSPGSLLSNEGRVWFNPPLAPIDAITYTHQLALALQHLHDHELTHGSLTFSNIMVARNPTHLSASDDAPFLLTDPGTAYFVRRFGTPKLTLLPISAAPEYQEKHFVPAGDQYALATLLYFWLAGRPPFLGSPDVLLQQKLTETIMPLTLFNPRVSARQEEVIHRALRSAPEKRYPSILAFAEALADSLQQSTHTILPDETILPFFQTYEFTTLQSVLTRLETALPVRQPVEQHTDELPQLERDPLMALNDEDEASTVHENSQSHNGSTPSDFEALMASLLETNLATPLASSYSNLSDADSMLDTEPALHDKLIITPGAQEYLSEMLDPEVNVLWNNHLLQEPPQPKIEPDVPQPLPPPEITPEPQPAPEPRPAPKTLPEPEQPPIILPQPEPDIAQPIPEPAPTPPEKPVVPPAQPPPTQQQAQNMQKVVPSLLITSYYQSEPREVSLENELITVGRAGSSDILLDHDNLTSRHHAVLKYDRDQYVIFDQRSAQGVYVNGQKLTVGVGWRLTDGDTITIGVYTLIFRAPVNDQVPSDC